MTHLARRVPELRRRQAGTLLKRGLLRIAGNVFFMLLKVCFGYCKLCD